MTEQMPIETRKAQPVTARADVVLPPVAPLAMPRQVLVRPPGAWRRMVRSVVVALSVVKHGLRRFG